MCIAIYSPIGNDVPCEKNLKASWEENPDGAGFAYNLPSGQVKIVKGFMTWDSFWDAFQSHEKKNDFKNRGVLIHFRIQTHGGVNPECTHPFPIVDDEGCLQKLEYVSPYAVIHNGIISLTSADARLKTKMSDTMVFVQKYLTKLATYKNWLQNDKTMELIDDLIDSKMAILSGDGQIHATTGFDRDSEDGNYYSNQSYKHGRFKKFSSYFWDSYDSYRYDSYSSYGSSMTDKKELSTTSGKEYKQRTVARLQALAAGQSVLIYDDATGEPTEMYDYDPDMPFYMDSTGAIFFGESEDGLRWIDRPIMYMGEGSFVNSEYKELGFCPDRWIYEDIIVW